MTARGENEDRVRALYDAGFLNLYVREAARLAAAVVADVERAYAMVPPRTSTDVDHYVSREQGDVIDGLLGHAAKLETLLREDRERGSKSRQQWALERERVGWLGALIENPPLPALTQARKVRNRLEHLDEYLDETGLRLQRGDFDFPALIALDLAVYDRQLVERAGIYALRLYLVEERVFLHAGREVNLEELRRECRLILDRLGAKAEEARDPALLNTDWGQILSFSDAILFPPRTDSEDS